MVIDSPGVYAVTTPTRWMRTGLPGTTCTFTAVNSSAAGTTASVATGAAGSTAVLTACTTTCTPTFNCSQVADPSVGILKEVVSVSAKTISSPVFSLIVKDAASTATTSPRKWYFLPASFSSTRSALSVARTSTRAACSVARASCRTLFSACWVAFRSGWFEALGFGPLRSASALA